VWTIGVIMAMAAFDVNLGPLIASAGIVGVALGFGAQALVRDFLTGLFMLAEDQFGIGDVIDVGEAEGVVEEISLRTTSLRGIDGTLWHVPNGEIHRVGNMSQDWARALLDVGVAYDADVDRAVEVIRDVGTALAGDPDYDQVVLEPPEILGVQDLAADAVLIRLWVKTLPGEQWGVARELRRRIKHALDDADISIPFPQRTVWLRHDGEAVGPDDSQA
jgi:small-conductance mechanosensitive channel